MDKRLAAFERLLNIMDELREKCPWDKKQTWETLRKLTIEETYELSDAIIKNEPKSIEEELGDLMLHMVFYSKIGEEKEVFNIETVLNKVCDKLIVRHPHIYGDVVAYDEEQVKQNWEQIKLKEGKTSVLQGVPNSMAPMVKAQRIQEKVRQIGFDWDNKEQVMEKVMEELTELKEAEQQHNLEETEMELGDVFFALINYARFIDIDAEQALEKTNIKFIKRFQWMESYVKEHQLDMKQMNLAELDIIWNKAKMALKQHTIHN